MTGLSPRAATRREPGLGLRRSLAPPCHLICTISTGVAREAQSIKAVRERRADLASWPAEPSARKIQGASELRPGPVLWVRGPASTCMTSLTIFFPPPPQNPLPRLNAGRP
ncbi:uncharacterized protein PSANT_02824 [Moesziomyces antarcticus]|uniref:Uncharacterized protein n=1 Tax=Pseudozyma antarctica TaxID=84753 RepID=A0A5C3FL96_PSEA2|nr:uncharacterized protein PSANT_02824 [Moesziomyces antarcticus]